MKIENLIKEYEATIEQETLISQEKENLIKKALKTEMPDIYENYSRTTSIQDSIRIKIK